MSLTFREQQAHRLWRHETCVKVSFSATSFRRTIPACVPIHHPVSNIAETHLGENHEKGPRVLLPGTKFSLKTRKIFK